MTFIRRPNKRTEASAAASAGVYGLVSLANRISERARSIQPIEVANMLSDEAEEF